MHKKLLMLMTHLYYTHKSSIKIVIINDDYVQSSLMMTEHSLVGIDLAEVQMMSLGLKKLSAAAEDG